jgi:hypothetical protein
MTVSIEQFFAAVEEQKNLLKQWKRCNKEDKTTIRDLEQRGEAPSEVMTAYGSDEWVRRYGSTRPNPFHPKKTPCAPPDDEMKGVTSGNEMH